MTGQDRNGIMCCSFNVSQKIKIVGHSKGGLESRTDRTWPYRTAIRKGIPNVKGYTTWEEAV